MIHLQSSISIEIKLVSSLEQNKSFANNQLKNLHISFLMFYLESTHENAFILSFLCQSVKNGKSKKN